MKIDFFGTCQNILMNALNIARLLNCGLDCLNVNRFGLQTTKGEAKQKQTNKQTNNAENIHSNISSQCNILEYISNHFVRHMIGPELSFATCTNEKHGTVAAARVVHVVIESLKEHVIILN